MERSVVWIKFLIYNYRITRLAYFQLLLPQPHIEKIKWIRRINLWKYRSANFSHIIMVANIDPDYLCAMGVNNLPSKSEIQL